MWTYFSPTTLHSTHSKRFGLNTERANVFVLVFLQLQIIIAEQWPMKMWVYMTIISFPSTRTRGFWNVTHIQLYLLCFSFLQKKNKNRKLISLTLLECSWSVFCCPIIPIGFMVWIWPHFCLCLSLVRVLIGSPLTGQPAQRTGDVYKCPVGHGSSSSCVKLDLPGENWFYSGFFPVCVFVQSSFFFIQFSGGNFHDKARFCIPPYCILFMDRM